jgi:HEAT repeat protein
MDTLFAIAVAAVAGGLTLLVEFRRQRAQMEAWRRAAARVGLTDLDETEGGLFGKPSLDGRAGEVAVRLERYSRNRGEHGTRIVVGLGHGPGGLYLRRESVGTAIEKRVLGEREIEIGDRSFDEEFFVQGRAPVAIAVLDHEARRRVALLLRGRIPLPGGLSVDVGASVSDGVLEVTVNESGFLGRREKMPEILAVVLDVARRLVAPGDLAARIAENLRSEPAVGVRVQAVRVLAREFPRHPATRDALLAACQDPSEDVRLRAGIALGEDGRGTLLELASGGRAHDACAAEAITSLGTSVAPDQVESALRRALRDPHRSGTAQACLAVLASLGRPEAEALVLQGLRSRDEPVAVGAARALGKLGTAASVPALREAAEGSGELRRAARQAVAEIQARLTGAAPGQLSLAGGDAGALSLAEDAGEAGRLSLDGAEPSRPHRQTSITTRE